MQTEEGTNNPAALKKTGMGLEEDAPPSSEDVFLFILFLLFYSTILVEDAKDREMM